MSDPNINPVVEDASLAIPPELETPPGPEEALAQEGAEQQAGMEQLAAPTPPPASPEAPTQPAVELPTGPFEPDPFMQDWDDDEMAAKQAEYERLLADAAVDETSGSEEEGGV